MPDSPSLPDRRTLDVMQAAADAIREVARLRAEVERLREALEHIAWAAAHPSATVNTASYLGRSAQRALDEEDNNG